MTKAQKTTLGVLCAIACVTLLAVLYTASQAYQSWSQQPLGPTLAYPTEWKLPATWTASASPAASPAAAAATSQPSITPVPILTQTPNSPFLTCNHLPPLTVLAIGTDVRPGERRHGLTDFMRAVRVDFQQQRVTSLEFPRDLWVEIPGIEENLGTKYQKLNTAYTYGQPDFGPSLLARTLDLNFGLKVDHYIVANMTVFADVVDALGGLDVTIPEGGIDGRTSTDRSARLIFPEGPQHLTGEQALTLARLRNVSVFERAEHQNMVMCALRKKIERPETIFRLPAIIDSFMDNVQTDLTPQQISQLACLGTQMPRSNIAFASFPLKLFEPDETYDAVLEQDVFVWRADTRTMRIYISEFQDGTWPSTSPSPAGTPEPEASGCE
ncbi:MAG TPA: LCP family protein [Anaerolineales bacterium]|nr:LCP family protein [Anaerolineales bacterium]